MDFIQLMDFFLLQTCQNLKNVLRHFNACYASLLWNNI